MSHRIATQAAVFGIIRSRASTAGVRSSEIATAAVADHGMTSRATVYRTIMALHANGLIRNVSVTRIERWAVTE